MNNRPMFIGIGGGSASGKTTIAERLEISLSKYRINTFHMDYYFQDSLPKGEAPVSHKEYDDYNHPLSFDLERLKNDIHDASVKRNYQVIVIEGLLTLWDRAIYDMLDLRVFVDCRADERIVRRLKRNMGYGMTFDSISEVYLDLVRFRHEEFVEPTKWCADIILNGSSISDISLEMLVTYISSKVEKEESV